MKDGELELERRKDLRPGFIGPVDGPEWRERRHQEEAEAEDDTGSSDDEYQPMPGRPRKRFRVDPYLAFLGTVNLGFRGLGV